MTTTAQQTFDALPIERKARIAAKVFAILEYDADGQPGARWDIGTLQALGDLFADNGVAFTSSPGEQ
jgi:hypothetical protein